jgi:hypothetical protein
MIKSILAIAAFLAIGFLFNENTEGLAMIVEKLLAIAGLYACARIYLAIDKGNEPDYSNEYYSNH